MRSTLLLPSISNGSNCYWRLTRSAIIRESCSGCQLILKNSKQVNELSTRFCRYSSTSTAAAVAPVISGDTNDTGNSVILKSTVKDAPISAVRRRKSRIPKSTTPELTTLKPLKRISRRPGSKLDHYDFNSFLQHLERTGKSTTSPTSVGTLYEYATIAALERLGFRSLLRCGRSGDNGVDIVGTCDVSSVRSSINQLKSTTQHSIFQVISKRKAQETLESENVDTRRKKIQSSEFNVIVQCKASEKSVSSVLMREMAGAYFGFVSTGSSQSFPTSQSPLSLSSSLPSSSSLSSSDLNTQSVSASSSPQTLVLVVTAGGRLTAPAFRQLEASQMPMVYMCLEKPRCEVSLQQKYNPSSYKLASISQVTPNKLAKDLLHQHGLSFRTVRSYVLKPRKIL